MKGTKKGLLALAALLIVAMLVSLAGCGSSNPNSSDTGSSGKKVYQIGVIQIAEAPALDAAYKGFKEEMAAEGYNDGDNIKLDYQVAQGDMNNLNTIATHLVSAKKDLILAIATPSAQAVANQTQTIPIVATAITDFPTAKLADSNDKPGHNVTGTSDLGPINEHIDLGLELVPGAKTLGVAYNSSEPNSVYQLGVIKKYAATKGLTVKEATATGTNDVQQAIQSLVTKCDFIYIPTDNTMASAMQTVSNVANAAKIPVIGGEPGLVKGGALATIGVDYESLGKATAKMAIDILKGKNPGDMPIQFPQDTSVIFNADTIKALGITIPEKYQQYVKAPADIS
ncbi:MAG: ABC transporter substrate-binding protein [Coriobacteriia bacterium]|nr:ABC transporter substrate-binding protein [Coriobacteriia bacterium]